MGVSGEYDVNRDSPYQQSSSNGFGDTTIQVKGSLLRCNQMLKHLKYQSNLNYNGQGKYLSIYILTSFTCLGCFRN